MIPLSTWAENNGISRKTASNLVRRGKIPGAERRRITNDWWYVPANARPDFTDRRKKEYRKRESPNARSA